MHSAVRLLLCVVMTPLPVLSQFPAIRDLPGGSSIGTYASIGNVVELPSGTVLVGESESGNVWRVAPGKSRGEMLLLSGAPGPFGGLALAGGERAYTFSTRALVAYSFGLDGVLGKPLGEAPNGAAMFMSNGAGTMMRPDSSGRLYTQEREPSGGAKLVSQIPGGERRVEGTIRGDAVPRISIGAGGASPTRILAPADGWAVRPDGAVAIVRAEPYRVEWLRQGARMVEGPIIPLALVPTTTADSTAWVEQAASATSRMGVRVSGTGSGGPAASMPAMKPPFLPSLIRVSSDGSLWVGLHGPAGATQAVWDHFDENARLIERVRLPAGYIARGFGTGVVYASTTTGELFRVPLGP